ncbi:MAG: hypothetical protein ATN34_00565 [Epulopiscium sp. Nele67-Bin002]|nr:MAG: hypothetical protein ATN34_00565 [Epulopiscium sp. Nele67-Bin002]
MSEIYSSITSMTLRGYKHVRGPRCTEAPTQYILNKGKLGEVTDKTIPDNELQRYLPLCKTTLRVKI